ncbi:pectinesterase inhibitor 9-like [Curcuma longa]|uniref:pectinesterase inhibitor 9-like n=1 Tax=Curcuma longa TaxID=136217 RepID=UPI003D9DB781
MVRSSDLSSVLVIAVICLSAGSLTAARKKSSAEFVRLSCKVTPYVEVCEQSLSSYEPEAHRSKRQLARLALALTADSARSASVYVSRVASSSAAAKRGSKNSLGSSTKLEAGAIRDCIQIMRDGVDRLRRSVREMNRLGRLGSSRFERHLRDVKAWVSAALTDENMCLDELSQFAGAAVRESIRKKMVELAQLISNALALVDQLDP